MAAALATGGWLFARGLQTPLATGPSRTLVDNVLQLVHERYIDSVPTVQLYERAVAGLLEELDDPYTTYLTRERFDRIEERASAQYAGVGLRVDLGSPLSHIRIGFDQSHMGFHRATHTANRRLGLFALCRILCCHGCRPLNWSNDAFLFYYRVPASTIEKTRKISTHQ